MVIQCSHCQAKFKLADDKLKPEGTKVRCSKCKEVFTVFPEAPPAEAEPETPAAATSFAFAPETETTAAGTATTGIFAGEPSPEPPSQSLATDEFTFDTTDFFAETAATAPQEPSASEPGQESFNPYDVFSEVETGGEAPTSASEATRFDETPAASAPGSEELAFGEFSFETVESAPAAQHSTEPSSDSFDFDDAASSFDFSQPEVSTSAPAFDFDEEPFAAPPLNESPQFDTPSFDLEQQAPPPSPLPQEPAAPEITTRPAQPTPAALEETVSPRGRKSAPAKRTMPPIPKPPRFRVSPLAILLRTIFLLFLIVSAGAVYFYYKPGIIDMKKVIGDVIGKSVVKEETGQIRIASLSASYIRNRHVGELLVVSGEAVNEYPGTRSAISVRAVLLDKSGKVLQQQVAFCGNLLSQSALQNDKFAALEAAMSNQFGDLMSNLNLTPGKTIPFTIVFQKLPSSMSEYSVEVADSKPGAQ